MLLRIGFRSGPSCSQMRTFIIAPGGIWRHVKAVNRSVYRLWKLIEMLAFCTLPSRVTVTEAQFVDRNLVRRLSVLVHDFDAQQNRVAPDRNKGEKDLALGIRAKPAVCFLDDAVAATGFLK